MQSVIGALRVNLGLDSAQFEKGLGRAHKRLGEMRRQFAGLAGLATAAASGLGVLTAATARSANEITRFSQVANAAPAELQRWAAGAKTVGIEQEKLADILKDVNDRVGDYMATGAGPMVDFFDNIAPKVGVTAEQFRRLSGPEALQLYVSSLEKAGASQQDMTFYLEAMASDATALLPLLANNGAEMARLAGNADSLGAVMDGQTVAALNRAHLALGDVGLAMQGVGNRIAGSLAPGLTTLATAFADSMREGGKLRQVSDLLIDNLSRLATWAATAVTWFGVRYVGALVAAKFAALGLVGALKALRAALIRSAIGAVVVLAGELVYQFTKLVDATGGFGSALSVLGEIGRDIFLRMGQAGRGLYLILKGAAQGIGAAFIGAFALIAKQWDLVLNGMAMPFNALMSGLGLEARIGASNIGGAIGDVAGQWRDMALASIAEGGDAIRASAGGGTAALERLRAIMAETGDDTLDGAAAADRLAGALAGGEGVSGGGAAGAADKAAKGTDKLSKAAEAAKKKLDDLRQVAEGWADRTATPLEKHAAQLAEIAEIQADPRLQKEFPKFDETAARAARQLNIELADSLPLVGGLTDALSEGLLNGFEGTVDQVKSLFKQMLAEMIAAAAKNQIIVSLGLSGSAGGAGGAAAGAALAGLGSAFSAGVGGFMSGGFASLGPALSGATGSMAGLATAAGAVALPVLATVAAIDFLRVKTKKLDEGVRLTANGMALAVDEWAEIRKSQFWGLKTSRSTDYTAAGRDIADPITRAFGEIAGGVTGMAETLGIGARAFDSFGHQIELSTKGMDEAEAAQALQDSLAGMGEAMAAHALEARLAIETGETASEALARLSGAITATRDAADLLGHALLPASIEGGKLASILVEAAGGLEAFGSATQAYLSGFYSDAERAAIASRRVADQMAALGVAMPESRAQFRAMVEAIDTGSAAGAQLYGELMGMAGALNEVLPAVASFTAEISELVGAVTSEIDAMIGERSDAMRANAAAAADWYRAAQTLRGFVADLAGTAGALVSPDRARAFNAARFETLLARGLAGDAQAVSDITGAAQAFLTSSAATARTAAEQARAEAKVLGDLQLLAGASDVEGARHDVVAGLLGQQVGVLEQVSDYLASGGVLDPSHIAGLEGQLGALEDAIGAAEMINYAFLKERLSVSVDLLAEADIPAYLQRLIGQAQDGITASIDFLVRSDLSPDLKWLALTGASEHIKTVELALEDKLPRGVLGLALTTAGDLQRTLNLVAGSKLPADVMRLGLAGSSELLRTVNAVLSSKASAAAKKLALGNVGAYDVAVRAALDASISSDVRKIVFGQVGTYTAAIGAALSEKMPEWARRVLLERQGAFTVNITGILASSLGSAQKALLLNANTSGLRGITVAMAYGSTVTAAQRKLLETESLTILRTISAAVNPAGISATGLVFLRQVAEGSGTVARSIKGGLWIEGYNGPDPAFLGQLAAGNGTVDRKIRGFVWLDQYSGDDPLFLKQLAAGAGRVERTIAGKVDLGSLNDRQKALLDAIKGEANGKITLGGSFKFDPSAGFAAWYEGATETAISTPMGKLRDSLGDLRKAINAERADLSAVATSVQRLAAAAGTDSNSRAVESIMSRAEFGDYKITADGRTWQGLHSINESQLYGLAKAFGVTLKNSDGSLRYSNNVRGEVEDHLRELGYITGAERLHRDFSAGRDHWENWLKGSGLPAFAMGGDHLGGLRLVGERGPEIEATGRSRIWSAEQTRRMLSGGGGGDTAALAAELRAVRAEIAGMRGEQRAAAVKRGADLEALREIQEKWEVIGQPGVRA